jgi:hypothetical protein
MSKSMANGAIFFILIMYLPDEQKQQQMVPFLSLYRSQKR